MFFKNNYYENSIKNDLENKNLLMIPDRKLKLGIISIVTMFLQTLFYIVSIFNNSFNVIFSNYLLFIFNNIELSRLFTAYFTSENLICYIFNMYINLTIMNYYENIKGTFNLFLVILFNFIVYFQIIIIIIGYITSYLLPYFYIYEINSFRYISLSLLANIVLQYDDKCILDYFECIVNIRVLLFFKIAFNIYFNKGSIFIEIILNLLCIFYAFISCKYEIFLYYYLELIKNLNNKKNLRVDNNQNNNLKNNVYNKLVFFIENSAIVKLIGNFIYSYETLNFKYNKSCTYINTLYLANLNNNNSYNIIKQEDDEDGFNSSIVKTDEQKNIKNDKKDNEKEYTNIVNKYNSITEGELNLDC